MLHFALATILCAFMLDFALVATFLAWHTIITSDAIGVIGLDRESRRLEFVGCPGLFPLGQKRFFFQFFHFERISCILDTSKRLSKSWWRLEFALFGQQKTKSLLSRCKIMGIHSVVSLNLIIVQLSQVKLHIKQFYSNILTERESNKLKKILV